MKGITIAAIGYFIIAFVTIILIIGLIGTKISPAIRNFYCSFLRGLSGILPLPEHMKPSLPSYCRSVIVNFETVIIEKINPKEIEFQIAAYCLACWESKGRPNYELVLKRTPLGEVTEDGVMEELAEVNFYDIIWKTDEKITSMRSISISYNPDSKQIEVV